MTDPSHFLQQSCTEAQTAVNVPASSGVGTLSFARRLVTQLLVNIAVVATLVTIAGFFVVQSYLTKLSGIFTYRIDTAVYVGAGVNLVLGTIGSVVHFFRYVGRATQEVFNLAISPDVLALVVSLLFLVGAFYFPRLYRDQHVDTKFTTLVHRVTSVAPLAYLLSLVLLLSVTYGLNGYEYSDRMFGGGKPAQVVLVFKEPDAIENYGFPFKAIQPHTTHSEPVQLLMELADGYLVRRSTYEMPVLIHNDLIVAVVDTRGVLREYVNNDSICMRSEEGVRKWTSMQSCAQATQFRHFFCWPLLCSTS